MKFNVIYVVSCHDRKMNISGDTISVNDKTEASK